MLLIYQPTSLKLASDANHKQIKRILMKARICTTAITVDIGGTPNQITESIRALPSCGVLPLSAVMVLTPMATRFVHVQQPHNWYSAFLESTTYLADLTVPSSPLPGPKPEPLPISSFRVWTGFVKALQSLHSFSFSLSATALGFSARSCFAYSAVASSLKA